MPLSYPGRSGNPSFGYAIFPLLGHSAHSPPRSYMPYATRSPTRVVYGFFETFRQKGGLSEPAQNRPISPKTARGSPLGVPIGVWARAPTSMGSERPAVCWPLPLFSSRIEPFFVSVVGVIQLTASRPFIHFTSCFSACSRRYGHISGRCRRDIFLRSRCWLCLCP